MPPRAEDGPPVWVLGALDDLGLTAAQFRVVCHLARLFNAEKGFAWPGRAEIARTCRLHEDTVDLALRELARRRIISSEFVPGRSKRYRFLPPSNWEPSTLPKAMGTHQNLPPENKGQEGGETDGYRSPETNGYHPPENKGYEGILCKETRDGILQEGGDAAAPAKNLVLAHDQPATGRTLAIATPHTPEARKLIAAIAILPGFAPDQPPDIEQSLCDVREERKMTTKGIVLAFLAWTKDKACFFKVDGVTAENWRNHFDGWLDKESGRGGSGYVKRFRDVDRFGPEPF